MIVVYVILYLVCGYVIQAIAKSRDLIDDPTDAFAWVILWPMICFFGIPAIIRRAVLLLCGYGWKDD